MAIANKVKNSKFITPNNILFAVEHQVSMSVVVAQAVGASVGGRKIAKAGTPITGNLDERATAFTAATTSTGSNVVGVLLHDVDVTDGDENGTILLHGFVNTNMLENDVQSKITTDVKKALPLIVFAKC